MDSEDREWILSVFGGVIASADMKQQVQQAAAELRGPDDPEIRPSDLAASQNYLKTCLLRRTVLEIQAMSSIEIAGLWARGCLGAARYRAAGGRRRQRE